MTFREKASAYMDAYPTGKRILGRFILKGESYNPNVGEKTSSKDSEAGP